MSNLQNLSKDMKLEFGWGAGLAFIFNGFLAGIQLIKIETVVTAAAVAFVSGIIGTFAQALSKYIFTNIVPPLVARIKRFFQ